MTSQKTMEALDRYFDSLPQKSQFPKYFTWYEYRTIRGLNNLELFLMVMNREVRSKTIDKCYYFKKSKRVRGLSAKDFQPNFN